MLTHYFNYKRFPNKNIANYLVRESLYYEEFCESLMALKEEQDGMVAGNAFDFSLAEKKMILELNLHFRDPVL